MNQEDKIHEWKKTSSQPIELDDNKIALYIYGCTECGESKIDY